MMRLRPLADRVVVERLSADSKSKGGILIPDVAKEKQAKGLVIAVGPGAINKDGTRRAVDVKVGQIVIFNLYAGAEYTLPEYANPVIVLHEDDIHGEVIKD